MTKECTNCAGTGRDLSMSLCPNCCGAGTIDAGPELDGRPFPDLSCFAPRRPALPNTVGLSGAMRDFMEWGRDTFPDATIHSCWTHLESEVYELGREIMGWEEPPPDAPESAHLRHEAKRRDAEAELADVLALAYHIAMKAGLDPVRALRRKLETNKRRNGWRPDGTRQK